MYAHHIIYEVILFISNICFYCLLMLLRNMMNNSCVPLRLRVGIGEQYKVRDLGCFGFWSLSLICEGVESRIHVLTCTSLCTPNSEVRRTLLFV